MSIQCPHCDCSGIPENEYSLTDACPACGNTLGGKTRSDLERIILTAIKFIECNDTGSALHVLYAATNNETPAALSGDGDETLSS